MRLEPFQITFEEQREIMEFQRQSSSVVRFRREFAQVIGRKLIALQLVQNLAELLGKSSEPRAGAEQFQLVAFSPKQCAKDHQTAFLVQHFRQRLVELVKDKAREPFKGKNVQPRI